MHANIQAVLESLFTEQPILPESVYEAFGAIMDGECDPVDISALLTALKCKGEEPHEIAAAARAMSSRAHAIPLQSEKCLDTCGTGGDRLHTFNISTAVAIVVAAAGVPVAKHGNRSVSSSSGSADVLEALGVNINLSPDQVAQCIEEIGIGFCFAPLFHGAMKYAAPVRKQLGYRTIFNLLGPLTNPASAEFQLIGANDIPTAEKLAGALSELRRTRATVVCGNGELDEVSLWGETTVFTVNGENIDRTSWQASDFDLSECRVDQLQVNTPEESAAMIKGAFSGEKGPARDMVLANAAAALWTFGEMDELVQAASQAAEAIDSGAVNSLYKRLVEWTTEATDE